jgi:hypothetical protein
MRARSAARKRLALSGIVLVCVVALTGCFGEGIHRVGSPLTSVQMPPGLWRSLGGDGCSWSRINASQGIAGTSTHGTGPQYMQVAPDDTGTTIHNCLPFWQQPGAFARPLVQPGQPFGDGDWLTNYEVNPGSYRASIPAGSTCTWAVMRGFHGSPPSGPNPDVVRSGTSSSGIATMTITADDLGFSSQGCGTWVPLKAANPAQGFDMCAAPSVDTAAAWMTSSPYTSMGIYLGGSNVACAQPNLTSSWITTVTAQGWGLLPIWVGPQAPCSTLSHVTTITATTATTAAAAGAAEANAAADVASALGLHTGPIYYDMEGYTRGGSCTSVVQWFTNGWVSTLHARGYAAGFYSSLCSGILDQAATYNDASYSRLDDVWIAAWNGTPNIFGFTSCAIPDSLWPNHQRVHQFNGGHDESWGGTTINIDNDAVDGATAP